MSEPERMVLLIDLYLGPQFGLFELQEQRMLPFNPAQHPLFGHPMARGMVLPEFRGTLAVAEELDCARFHPRFVSEEFDEEPTCWVGDILLFLRDGHGPYIVDQDIKDTSSSFELPTIGVTLRTDLSRLMTKERARHKVQEVLYRDVGIPTRRIAGDEVNPILIGNLYQLHAWSRRKASLNASQQEHLLDSLREGMDKGASAWEVLKLLELSHGYPTYHSKIVMYQAIWIQRLRLELLSARLWIDEPMVPEVRRVVDEYGHWFSRGEK
ncbi:hypothetical protein FHW64_005607 [Variovorax sp. Sphag1AA]|nr:hypothetical protein [Variovorax sp. Sphag1AA]